MTVERRRLARTGAVGIVLALWAGSCSGAEDSRPRPDPVAGTGRRGGTLTLLDPSSFEHIDPQRNYVGSTMNVARLFTRTLVTYKAVPGAEGTTIVPDLATDLGTPSDGNTVWTWTLKDGVRWEDGSAITCRDIKHGVERSFSDLITGGPRYAQQYLASTQGYQGPYVDGNNRGRGLASIVCDGDRRITFTLDEGVGDFNYVVASGQFAPVRPEKDTREKYDNTVFSSGPYKIRSYDRDRELVLDRNVGWDPATDPVRTALPDEIRVQFGLDPDAITRRLIADARGDQRSVMSSGAVPPGNVRQVLDDPVLKQRAVSGFTGFIRYLAINTRKVPDIDCRRAFVYAMDKAAYRDVLGGESFGSYATTMITPALRSHQDSDVHGLKDTPTGDVTRAENAFGAGKNCPRTVRLDVSDTSIQREVAAVVAAAYQRIGVKVVPNPIPRTAYYGTLGRPAAQSELSLAGWGPDRPNGSSIIPPLFDGRRIVPEGNLNLAQLNAPEINELIDAANDEVDPDEQARLWGELDQRVQEQAVTIPLVADRIVQLHGSKVGGAYVSAAYGFVDVVSLSAG